MVLMFSQYVLNVICFGFVVSVIVSTVDSTSERNFTPIHNSPSELIKYIQNDYDKFMLPNISAGTPLDVKLDIYVVSVEPIIVTSMKFSIQIYLRQYWKDERLQFRISNNSCTDYVSLHPELISKVWIPDTYIENEVKKDVRSRALVIFSSGLTLLSERLNVEAYCHLDLQKYPMDVQECTLKFQSYSYAACELRYSWFFQGEVKSVRLANSIPMPNYVLTGLETYTENQMLKTGRFSRLIAKFQFTHKMMYVLMRDYLPAAFIVVTSWLSFYIDPAASPARVSLAVITVLSIATQLTSTFNATPEVSYIKAIDWYVIGCFLFVFAAMIEYGFTHKYGGEGTANKASKYQEGISNPGASVHDCAEDEAMTCATNNSSMTDSSMATNAREHHEKMARFRNAYTSNYSSTFTAQAHTKTESTVVKRESSLDLLRIWWIDGSTKLSSADAISRVVFPLLFLIFNIVYWLLVHYI